MTAVQFEGAGRRAEAWAPEEADHHHERSRHHAPSQEVLVNGAEVSRHQQRTSNVAPPRTFHSSFLYLVALRSNAVQIDLLYKEEVLGAEHSLEYILKSRGHKSDEEAVLTYRHRDASFNAP